MADVRPPLSPTRSNVKKNWEDVDFTVLKTNQQLLRLDDGSRTLTRMDVIHTNVIPNAIYRTNANGYGNNEHPTPYFRQTLRFNTITIHGVE